MFKKWLICLFLIIYSFAFGYSEQVVVSQFDIALKTSSDYILSSGVELNDKMFGVLPQTNVSGSLTSDGVTLDNTIGFSYTKKNEFSGNILNSKYNYTSTGTEKSVVIPVKRNTGTTTVSGAFQLIETSNASGEDVTNYIIDQSFTLPIKYIDLESTTTSSKGIKFKYTEPNSVKVAHRNAFKAQNYMIRISRASTATSDSYYDITNKSNEILEASTISVNKFLNGVANYVDFTVEGDEYEKEQSITTDSGVGVKFIPGNLEVFGLPNGSYRIELYSFRYTNTSSNRGSVVITQEDVTDSFTVANNTTTSMMEILGFTTSSFPNITASILTISDSKLSTSDLSVSETVVSTDYVADGVTVNEESLNNICLDGTTVSTLVNGQIGGIGKYYQKWTIKYNSKYAAIDTNVRTAKFSAKGLSGVSVDYSLYIAETLVTDYPHQTIFALFNSNKSINGIYGIEDENLSKYTMGYRKVIGVTDTSLETMYKGFYTSSMTMTPSSYDWEGSATARGLIINKAISDSQGTFSKISGSGDTGLMTYYTVKGITGLTYQESGNTDVTDSATFTWTSPEKSSFDTAISQDKIIFRIVRLGSNAATSSVSYQVNKTNYSTDLPRYYYNPTNPTNPIKSLSTDLDNFVSGTTDYVDLVFGSGTNETKTSGNASFVYSSSNLLGVYGLSRDSYLVQVYTLQNADTANTYDYRVLTYGDYKTFAMGLPKIESSSTLKKQNNIFMINSINYVDGSTTNASGSAIAKRDVTVEFFTKTQQTLDLDEYGANIRSGYTTTAGGIIGKIDENKYNGTVAGIASKVSPITVAKGKEDFKYPLDIVFVIDDSGSMGDEITAVKTNLKSFSEGLYKKGFDIKYNLITFGPSQTSAIGTSWRSSVLMEDNYHVNNKGVVDTSPYLATFKQNGAWFDGTTSTGIDELKGALTSLNATGGYYNGQENGAWGFDRAIKYLSNNGRYLSPNNKPVLHSEGVGNTAYLPSKKWIIFLTDENMDSTYVSGLGYTSGNVVSSLSTRMYDEGITLTGIYNLNVNGFTNNANATAYATSFNSASTGAKAKATNNNVAISDMLTHQGNNPSDQGDIYYSAFATTNIGTDKALSFYPYEMGTNGTYISAALTSAMNNIGIVQTWNLKYSSPYPESDGNKREVIFALDNIYEKNTSGEITTTKLAIKPVIDSDDRFYIVPQSKITAMFENPNSNNYLIRKDGKIVLSAIAQSLYTDNGVKVNKPIIKGTFILKDTTTGHLVTVDSTQSISRKVNLNGFTHSDNTLWYRATSAFTQAEFEEEFGKNPTLTVKFIAETADTSKEITAEGVKVVENDLPKITKITGTNVTLADFMGSLKVDTTTLTFTSAQVTDAAIVIQEPTTAESTSGSGITAITKQLNVKDGDNIKYEFEIDDESIYSETVGNVTTNYGTVKVTYNGLPYPATYVEKIGGTDSTKTKWQVTVPYVSGVNNIRVDVTDGSLLANNRQITGTSYVEPQLIANTTFEENLNAATNSYIEENYYNDNLNAAVKNTNALGYLTVFDWDKNYSDNVSNKNYTETNSKKWSSDIDGIYPFEEGKYTYNGTVYVMNKAGAISGITSSTVNTLSSIINRINIGSTLFYVDKTNPVINNKELTKISDLNTELNSGDANSIINGLIGEVSTGGERAYKGGDKIKISGGVSDYNFSDIAVKYGPFGIFTGAITTTNALAANANNIYSFSKLGTAYDLTYGTGKINSGAILAVYDKAGNKTTTAMPILYDDNIPTTLSTLSGHTTEWSVKYTNNSNLPLISFGSTPISVATFGSGYIANFTGKTSGNMTDFKNGGTTYSAGADGEKIFSSLTNYSYSGVKVGGADDSIVLDTKINDDDVIIDTAFTALSTGYSVNLASKLASVKEIVGLEKFKLSTTHSGVKLNNSYTFASTYSILGALYYKFPTASAGIISSNIYSLYIPAKGDTVFNLTLFDRLGNEKLITYIVRIPNNVSVIGKKTGSGLEIKTQINANGKMKIDSRTER